MSQPSKDPSETTDSGGSHEFDTDAKKARADRAMWLALIVAFGFVAAVQIVGWVVGQQSSDSDNKLSDAFDLVSIWALGLGLTWLSVWIHYGGSKLIKRFDLGERKRMRLPALKAIALMFGLHIVVVQLFGMGMYACVRWLGAGDLAGETTAQLSDYLYFSLATYTSLGLGDFLPEGELRLLTGMEALIGLILIAWTAALFYNRIGYTDDQD